MNKLLITINNKDYIDDFKSNGIDTFAFPLSGFSIGYENYFDIKEVIDDSYIIINRMLDTKSVELLKQLDFSKIKGILFEDLAVYNIFKDSNLELIYLNSHFSTNVGSINYWLKENMKSIVISSDITEEEIENIVNKCNGLCTIFLFGLNMIMYSRRYLLTNYNNYYNLDNKNILDIKNNNINFFVYENEFGTVIFNKKIYNGSVLYNQLDHDKIKYFYINDSFINHDIVMEFISSLKEKEVFINDLCDNGFLYKETVFKVGDFDA